MGRDLSGDVIVLTRRVAELENRVDELVAVLRESVKLIGRLVVKTHEAPKEPAVILSLAGRERGSKPRQGGHGPESVSAVPGLPDAAE